MSTQIAVRLPDELVTYLDELVAGGRSSRAAVVTDALQRYQRSLAAERDAQLLRELGDYDDFADLPTYAVTEDGMAADAE